MNKLKEIAAEANSLHKEIQAEEKEARDKLMRIGELLWRCLYEIPEKEKEQWVRINCNFSYKEAKKLIKFYVDHWTDKYRDKIKPTPF